MSRALRSVALGFCCLLIIPLACNNNPDVGGPGTPGDGDGDGNGVDCEELFGSACETPCNTDNPCPAGMHCRAGKCDAECKTDEHCSGNQTCSPSGICGDDIVIPGDGDGDCEPQTCEEVGFACGFMIDRCDNIIDCAEEGLSCGGNFVCAGNPTECVSADPWDCDVCDKIPDCSDQDQFTVLRGRVVSPGRDDNDTANQVGIPNALVYILRSTDLDELPPISTGLPEDGSASCDRCEDQDYGPVLAGAVTDATGVFEISERIPLDTDMILVVKAGKFRRATVLNLPEEGACTDIDLPTDAANNPTRLPRRSDDGLAVNIPHIAVATGAIDGMECVFRKMGIDPEEFGSPGTDRRIHLYRANGAWPPDTECTGCVGCARCAACGTGSGNTDSNCRSRYCTESGTGTCSSTCRTNFINACRSANCTANGTDSCNATCQDNFLTACQEGIDASLLAEESGNLPDYDLGIFSCEGSGWDSSIARSSEAVRHYANRGGRVFASHLSFTWLHESADAAHGSTPYSEEEPFLTGLGPAASWVNGAVTSPNSGPGRISIDRDNVSPRIRNFADWMIQEGVIGDDDDSFNIIEPRSQVNNSADENGLGPYSEEFVYCESGSNGCANQRTQQFSFPTPYGAPSENVCGRVAYSGFHVSSGGNNTAFANVVFPSYCEDEDLGNGGVLTDQEKILLYMMFDLGACVGDDPPPPPCVRATCPENACGVIPDQCGGVLDCGTCMPMPPR